jgi:prepilin-type N-terminal cleavage/methylation domain-containing protein
MKQKLKIGRGFTLVELLVVIVIIAALAGLTAPMVIRQRKKADQTEAVSNARQIGMALFDFDTEYGGFPDATTAATVAANTATTASTDTKANGRFRQLFLAGITTSEPMFYAKTAFTVKPDGDISTPANRSKALENGECGFAMIVNSDDTAMSSAGNSNRILLAAPLDKTLTGEKFDKDPYDSKAVLLRLDNSVSSVTIAQDSTVKINKLPFFDTTDGGAYSGMTTAPKFAFPISK